eukprot:954672_1
METFMQRVYVESKGTSHCRRCVVFRCNIWRCSDFFPRVCGAGFGDFGINAIVLMSHDEENEEVDLTVSMDLCEDFGDTGIEFILGGDAEVCTEELGFGQNADLKFDIFKGSFPLDVSQFDCTTKA